MKSKTHFFFDMDGTVTLSRTIISPEMKMTLQKLLDNGYTIAVTSGSHNQQMQYQIDNLPIIKMGQNGNHTIDADNTQLWIDELTATEKEEILRHTNAIWELCNHSVPDENDLFEDRGSQISFSLYGHHADPVAKRAFDGDFKKRQALLEQVPFHSDTIEVKLGGSTCFDYFRKGHNKGFNIKRYIQHKNWEPTQCVFFGDALFPGGNDESVVGVIDTIAVRDPDDTQQKLETIITSQS